MSKSSRGQGPLVRMWVSSPPEREVRAAMARLQRAEDVQHMAIMPDVHLVGNVCIGTVLATSHLIYPQAVGADIGCGMAAVAFDCDAGRLSNESLARAVLAGLREAIPVMRHRSRLLSPSLPVLRASSALSDPRLASAAEREGRVELGTLGRGNHFLELQADEDDRLCLMVHSGSRAMGQLITNWHAGRATRATSGLFHLEVSSPQGQAYLSDLEWARRYADANRRLIVEATCRLLKAILNAVHLPESILTCDHNHVQHEEHFGQNLWVHRKGANPASEGQPGIIPGSMGTRSFHVVGRGCAESLCSSSHGAGRAMTRHQARRLIPPCRLRQEVEGVWIDEQVADRLSEEAPSAYKDINAVMRAQKDLVRITRRLRPVLCYKGI